MIEGSYRPWDLYTTGQLVGGLQQKKKTGFHSTEMESCRLFLGDNFIVPPGTDIQTQTSSFTRTWVDNSLLAPKLFIYDISRVLVDFRWEMFAWTPTIYTSTYIYIYIYEVHMISFQTFFVWALLLIVHTWNSSPLRSILLRLQCTCIVPTTFGKPHGSPLVWASQPLSSPQLSHNDSL